MSIESKRLEQMLGRIEFEEKEKAKCEGELSQILRQLKEAFDCHDTKSARKKLQELERAEKELRADIQKRLAKLEKEHAW